MTARFSLSQAMFAMAKQTAASTLGKVRVVGCVNCVNFVSCVSSVNCVIFVSFVSCLSSVNCVRFVSCIQCVSFVSYVNCVSCVSCARQAGGNSDGIRLAAAAVLASAAVLAILSSSLALTCRPCRSKTELSWVVFQQRVLLTLVLGHIAAFLRERPLVAWPARLKYNLTRVLIHKVVG